MPKPKPSPEINKAAIEADELTETVEQLTALEQKAIARFGRLALEAGLGDIQITNAKIRSGFGDMVANHKTDKPRTTPLLRCRNKLARLKRKAAHTKKLAQTKDKRGKIKSGEWLTGNEDAPKA